MQSTVDLTDTWCCGATPLLFSIVNGPAETLAKLDRDYPSLAKMAADGGAYDPPQLNPARTFVSCCLGLPWPDSCNLGTVNWFSHRSPLCALCPAAVCLGYMKCCFGFTELSLLESGDEVFIEMLQRGVAPEQCPERLKGLYWMQDNLANEVLVTFQDAYWQPATATAPFLGTKDLGLNFTRDPTCFGVCNGPPFSPFTCPPVGCCPCLCLPCWAVAPCGSTRSLPGCCLRRTPMTLVSSPDQRWIDLGLGNFIFIPTAGETLVAPGGEPVAFDAAQDLLRVSFYPEQGLSSINYQYRVRRVAHLSESGALVKTEAWDDLVAKVRATNETPGCLGDRCYCNLPLEQRLQNSLLYQNDRQFFRLPPRPASMALGRG